MRSNPQKLRTVDPDIVEIIISVPLPPRELQVNRRSGRHWGQLVAPKDIAKVQAAAALKEAVPDPKALGWTGCNASAVFIFSAPAARDTDNLLGWLKFTQDTLAKELGFNDSKWRWAREPTYVVRAGATERVSLSLRKPIES